jgi:hypothetical protein
MKHAYAVAGFAAVMMAMPSLFAPVHAAQPVIVVNTVPVTGAVSVRSLPPVSGTVGITGTPNVNVTNPVTIANPVSAVTVGNTAANPIPVVGNLSATVNDPAKTAFFASGGGPVAANTFGGFIFEPSQIPAGQRLVVESISYRCISARGPGPAQFLVQWPFARPGSPPGVFQNSEISLSVSNPVDDGLGGQLLAGTWSGRVYADHGSNPYDLSAFFTGPHFVAPYGSPTDGSMNCSAFLSGYLVPIP